LAIARGYDAPMLRAREEGKGYDLKDYEPDL